MPYLWVPFTNTKQEKTFWCWAAVAANVYNSMRPTSVPAVSQCAVVTQVEGVGNCNSNNPDSLPSALFDLGIIDERLARPRLSIIDDEFTGVSDLLDSGGNENGIAEPVCAEILFAGGAVHYVAITAVDTDARNVWVADPYIGGSAVEFAYDDFINHYNYAQPNKEPYNGTVQHLQRVVNKWKVNSANEVPMTLTPIQPAAPQQIKKAFQDGLLSFRSFRFADPVMQRTLFDSQQALQVFTIGVPDVLPGGDGLKGAKAAGWRIAASAAGTALAGDIYTLGTGGKKPIREGTPRLACVRQGAEIDTMLRAIAALSARPFTDRLRAEAFQLRLLVFPGLFTEALWLQPETPGSPNAFIVPYHTLVENVRAMSAYSERELIELLRPVAEKWQFHAEKPARRATRAHSSE
jgi:hypothetical protein